MNESKELQVAERIPDVELLPEDVKKHICPNATDKELYMFMNIARSYGLNPFKREIHFVKYNDKQAAQIIVGYEIYLKRAEKTNMLDGWNVVIKDKGKDNERAEITIYRKDQQHPFVWEVFRSEFDKRQSTWVAMPQFMLKKVAIAQGFRLAFPVEMGGMPYIPEEISDSASETLSNDHLKTPNKPKIIKKDPIEPLATTEQKKKIIQLGAELKEPQKPINQDEVKQLVEWYRDGNNLTKKEAVLLIENFNDVLEEYLDQMQTRMDQELREKQAEKD